MLKKGHKLFNRHLRLDDDGLRRLRGQISTMQWDHDMKMSLHAVAKISVTARLVMHVKARSQQGLEKFL